MNPGWVWRSQIWWSPARHCAQLPHAHTNGTVTRSPGRQSATPAPTASTTPASSCPGTCGNARMSGSWPIQPCQSLRQSPLASTRTTAPCGAGSGSAHGLDGRHPPEGLVHDGAHAASLEGHNPAVDNAQIADRLDAFAVLLELSESNPYTIRAYRRAADVIRDAAVPVAGLVTRRAGPAAARDRPGHRGAAARARRDGGDRGARRARARAGARAGRARPLPRPHRAALDRDRAGARRPDPGGAARGGRRRPAADRAGRRPEARGAAARRARPRPGAAAAAGADAERRARARRRRSPRRSAPSRRATPAAGATPASGSRSWPRRTSPGRCWRASPRSRRSSPCSSRASGARSA